MHCGPEKKRVFKSLCIDFRRWYNTIRGGGVPGGDILTTRETCARHFTRWKPSVNPVHWSESLFWVAAVFIANLAKKCHVGPSPGMSKVRWLVASRVGARMMNARCWDYLTISFCFCSLRLNTPVYSIAESLANPTLELIVVGNLITWMSWSSEKKIFYDSWPHFTPIYIYLPYIPGKMGFKNRKRSKQGQIFPIETGGLWSIDPTTSPTPPPEKIVKKWSKTRGIPIETIDFDRWSLIDWSLIVDFYPLIIVRLRNVDRSLRDLV